MKTTDNLLKVPGVVYSRAGAATAWRADGTLATFAANVPRITDLGLTIEGQRTNQMLYWDPTFAQIATKGGDVTNTTEPNNAPIAGRKWIRVAGYSGAPVFAYAGCNSIPASTPFTFTCFIETPDGTSPVYGVAGNEVGTDFRLGLVQGGAPLTPEWAFTRRSGNVWEFRLTGVTPSSAPSVFCGPLRGNANQNTRPLKFSGFQLELASKASTPIITTGAAATVGADNLYLGGLANTLQDPFSVIIDTAAVAIQSGLGPAYFSVSSGSTNNRITAYRSSSGAASVTVRSESNQVGGASMPSPGSNPVKFAIAVNGAVIRWAVNGVLGTAITVTAVPIGLDRVHPLSYPTAAAPGETVARSLQVLPYALTDSELVNLTQ